MAANGILVIDKPQDWTSMDVCAKLRGALGERRIGHAGTLDPMATGVLPVFVGRATRAVEFASEGDKEYLAGLRLGTVTDTQDTTGHVLEEHPVQVTRQALEAALAPFRGEIQQLPPMYSAIKVNGKKLYELARKGREVERKPRAITIYSLDVEGQESPTDYYLRVRCSKGTYIRTLCHDIGQALGCGGTMFSLRRTMACGFTLADAVPLEQVLQTPDPSALLLGVDTLFADRPVLTLGPDSEKKVRNGTTLLMPGLPEGECRVYSRNQEFLALCRVSQGKLTTIKSFFQI
ncbi:tRNA pseudouridine(55) synthase TruB [Flavonifractor sp. An100]|uniref:tRNA pseudouridine(55) synthase TruB n=1 Tax=Flavonifractor sp. An100 TaxID=1965538 RepID=UPI000B380E24|nr:tRNA pseudouridine(55) synthase TruB [Flavonifractor sp. An100]OUQ82293.1 tRNA pseudouridine(55) synthase TruB [Flavonifractor sp. An100]